MLALPEKDTRSAKFMVEVSGSAKAMNDEPCRVEAEPCTVPRICKLWIPKSGTQPLS